MLDQPNIEMRKLEKIMMAFSKADELDQTKNKTRKKNKGKHGS